MRIADISRAVDGRVVCGESRLSEEVGYAFASDLMSDVLTLKNDDFVLLTGLANIQVVRTAEMADVGCLLLCRGKRSSREMEQLARESGMVMIESPYSLFKCSGLLYEAGLKPVF
jgi:hypothetical protein